MKYKLSKINEINNFVSEIKVSKTILYLLKDKDGKDLKELAKPYYEILRQLMDYSSIEESVIHYNKNNK